MKANKIVMLTSVIFVIYGVIFRHFAFESLGLFFLLMVYKTVEFIVSKYSKKEDFYPKEKL